VGDPRIRSVDPGLIGEGELPVAHPNREGGLYVAHLGIPTVSLPSFLASDSLPMLLNRA
jgi:hypothetical protein